MRELKALFAGDNDYKTIVAYLNEQLSESEIGIGDYEVKSTKEGFFSYILSGNTPDLIVAPENFGDDIKFTPKELEQILVKLGNGVNIIIISSANRGSDELRDYLACGIFNVLLESQGDNAIENIAERIAEPCDRAKAMAYYGIVDKTAFGASTVENDGNRVSEPVVYVSQAMDDEGELRNRLVRLESELSESEFMKTLIALPEQLIEKVRAIPNYRTMAGLALTEKRSRERKPGDQGEKKDAGTGKGNVQAGHARMDIKSIAFLGTEKGNGCTWSSILCAQAMAMQGTKTAVVEMNRSGHLKKLCSLAAGREITDNTYRIGEVDYFFDTKFTEIKKNYMARYDYVLFDFGVVAAADLQKFTRSMDRIFVVAGGAEYKADAVAPYADSVNGLEKRRSFTFLFPLTEEADLGIQSKVLGSLFYTAVPYEPNMFMPSEPTCRMFLERVTDAPVRKVSDAVRMRTIEDKLSERQAKPQAAGKAEGTLRAAFFALLILTAVISAVFISRNRAVVRAAEESANGYEERIAELLGKEAAANDRFDSLDAKVCALIRPVAAGTPITAEMIREYTIKSDMSRGTFARADEIAGKVAAVNIDADVPIYPQYVAAGGVERLPEVLIEERVAEEKPSYVLVGGNDLKETKAPEPEPAENEEEPAGDGPEEVYYVEEED